MGCGGSKDAAVAADSSAGGSSAPEQRDDTAAWSAVSPTAPDSSAQPDASVADSDLSTVAASPANRRLKQRTLGISASSEDSSSGFLNELAASQQGPPPAFDLSSMLDSAKSTAAFLTACRTGDTAGVRALLALPEPARVNVHVNGDRCVELAAENGHAGVLRELLALGGDRLLNVHARDEGALVAAASEGHTACLELLMELTGDRAAEMGVDDSYPLRIACEFGHTGVVRAMLQARARGGALDVHACNEDALQRASMCGHVEIARMLLALRGADQVDVAAAGHAAFREACRGDPGTAPAGGSPTRSLGTVTSSHADIAVELLACVGPAAVPPALWSRLRCGQQPATQLRRDAAWRGGVRRLPRCHLVQWASRACEWSGGFQHGSQFDHK